MSDERYPVVMTALTVLNILKEESDSEHPITRKYLAEKLGCNWKKISRALDTMESTMNFSYGDIRGKGIYYKKNKDDFNLNEVRMLIDSVLASKVISAKETKSLVDKLSKLLNKYDRRHVRHIHTYKEFSKSDHEEMFVNIEILDEAIENYRQVSFDYNTYTIDKSIARYASYRISPYQLVFLDGKYLVLAKTDMDDEIHSFRIDMMSDIKLLDARSNCSDLINDPEAEASIYVEGHPYMHIGRVEPIEMKLNENAIDRAIDAFGKKIIISFNHEGLKDDEVWVRFRANTEDVFRFALLNADAAQIIEPQSVRTRLLAAARQMNRGYLSTSGDFVQDEYSSIIDASNGKRMLLPPRLSTKKKKVMQMLRKENTADLVHNLKIDELGEDTLDEIKNYINLKRLTVNCKAVEDLSFISSFKNLEHLLIQKASVRDLSPIISCSGLKSVAINNTPVENGEVFAALPALCDLYIHDTAISDISFLPKCTGIRLLDIGNNRIDDFSPLSESKSVNHLFVDYEAAKRIDLDELRSVNRELTVTVNGATFPAEHFKDEEKAINERLNVNRS